MNPAHRHSCFHFVTDIGEGRHPPARPHIPSQLCRDCDHSLPSALSANLGSFVLRVPHARLFASLVDSSNLAGSLILFVLFANSGYPRLSPFSVLALTGSPRAAPSRHPSHPGLVPFPRLRHKTVRSHCCPEFLHSPSLSAISGTPFSACVSHGHGRLATTPAPWRYGALLLLGIALRVCGPSKKDSAGTQPRLHKPIFLGSSTKSRT